MVTIEELKAKYPVQTVAPYGECVIVPGNEFDPDWEADLEEQTEDVMVNGEPVTLIILKSEAESDSEKAEPAGEERLVTSPNNEDRGMAEFPWSEDEEEKLVHRMNELDGTVYERASLLMPEFKGRSVVALRQKYYKLTGLKAGSKRKWRPKPEFLHAPWDAKEDDLLIELWNKRMKTPAIAEKLPGRGYESVKMRLQKLKKEGLIKPRWTQKSKKPLPSPAEKLPTDVHTKAPTEVHKVHSEESVPAQPSENEVIVLLREIRGLLKGVYLQREPELINFDTYCRKCKDSRTVEENVVWRVCPVCGEELIVWGVKEVLEALA